MNPTEQLELFIEQSFSEDPIYLSTQLITYIGNKRALLGHIARMIAIIKKRLGRKTLRAFDVFTGSGIVSRFLKAHSEFIVVNDLEDYAAAIGRCYLQNKTEVDTIYLDRIVADMNRRIKNDAIEPGFIREFYAPKDENQIEKGDRCFYTVENAERIDRYRCMINEVEPELQDLLLGPLLSAASIHTNTSGMFSSFYKNKETGLGQFGGTHQDALDRICAPIIMESPILSRFECEYEVIQGDANLAALQVKDLDLAYLDPPYNGHSYSGKYFMLNLIAHYRRPDRITPGSGIPFDKYRSGYNSKKNALPLFKQLVNRLDARYLLISFSDEGFISPNEMITVLKRYGKIETFKIPYTTFRAARNRRQLSPQVTEYLFLVEKK